MIRIAALTLLALLGTVVLTLAGWGGPVAAMHLAFAVGVVPLIFAAISHFVPVLTRTGEPAQAIRAIPALAQGVGLLAVAIFLGWLPYGLLSLAIVADFVLALCLLIWIVRRASRCLGSPHPCWRWYGAALISLLLALLAVALQGLFPEQHLRLRAVHLHLNTLGLLGSAALGTLPVLMPTVLGQADASASRWLRRAWWPWTLAMVLLLVALMQQGVLRGALLLLATITFLAVVFSLLRHWHRGFGWHALSRNGAAISLLAATLGLAGLLMMGLLHGLGWVEARPAITAWEAGFLLPLVTGALSQLLPVWAYPGPVIPARLALRSKLIAHGHWRAVLFLGAACAFHFSATPIGAGLALAGILLFLLPALALFRRHPAASSG